MFPKVSILIPCYNAFPWLEECLLSALNQTYENKEIIVIDDGSQDESLSIIKKYESSIIWRNQTNMGGNITRNKLLELSTGTWIQYLDADDYLLPNKILNQVNFLHDLTEQNKEDIDVIYSPHIFEEQQDDQKQSKIFRIPNPEDPWLLAINWRLPQTGAPLFRKSALLEISGWDESLPCCQDYDLYVRLLIAGKQFAYFEQAEAVYRWWNTGSVSRKQPIEMYLQRIRIHRMIDEHLRQENRINDLRADAIEQGYFEYARRIYQWDRLTALDLIQEVSKQNSSFEPSAKIAGKLYQIVYKLFGFEGAENVANLKRSIAKLLQR